MAPRYLESSGSRLNPLALAFHMIDMPSTAMTTQASDPVDEAVRLHDLAVAAREDRRHDEAERLARESLAIFESADPESPDVANVLLCLAGTHEDRAEYAAAHILEQLPENRYDLDVQRLRMQAIDSLGNVLRALGRYREAEPRLKQALAIAERT